MIKLELDDPSAWFLTQILDNALDNYELFITVDFDAQAVEKLTDRLTTIAKAIDLFNESDWQLQEVAMWLQYEKDLALTESKLYHNEE